jgi:hypothetical protein
VLGNCDADLLRWPGKRQDRKTRVPVVHTDFTSQYPTANALLGNWDVLKASSIRFEDCTAAARKILFTVELEDTFNREFWKRLPFFVLMGPQTTFCRYGLCMAEKLKTLA